MNMKKQLIITFATLLCIYLASCTATYYSTSQCRMGSESCINR